MAEPIPRVYSVAVPLPLHRLFDYTAPATHPHPIPVGSRVCVPFGARLSIGIVVAASDAPDCDPAPTRLRAIRQVLDSALLDEPSLRLLNWASTYYHHPIGEVLCSALPTALRQPYSVQPSVTHYQLSESGVQLDPAQLSRAPRQQALLAYLQTQNPPSASAEQLQTFSSTWRAAARALEQGGWVRREQHPLNWSPPPLQSPLNARDPELNAAQSQAVAGILAGFGQFYPVLLEGVTGSGKTEVYIQLMRQALEQQRQVLVLLPEIALTPQLAARFQARFGAAVGVIHSGLNDGERLRTWLAARHGDLPILLGTRSAVFTPLPRLGLIVVDEEHDASYKQHEGFRLHARDVAMMRAHFAGVSIVLGSATPSLESVANVARGRYQHWRLPERAGGAKPPSVRLLDVRRQHLDGGVSPALREALTQAVQRGDQALLFLNRRGYAPVLLCHACAWTAHCTQCDANLVLHASTQRLRCHHCGFKQSVPRTCPTCGSDELNPIGQGTEKLEQTLRRWFPQVGIARVDRDSIRRVGELERLLNDMREQRVQILLGTQMLTKGHDFPNVTLVGILDVDGGLFSVDFRAPERLAQLLVQVAGRAGRADKPGSVWLQTHQPDHPLLQTLLKHGYAGFSQTALAERAALGLPPYAYQALLRADAEDGEAARDFLQAVLDGLPDIAADVQALGPVPAPRERLAARHRWQLLLQSDQRPALHAALRQLRVYAPTVLPARSRVRWSLDVDPIDLY